MIKTPTTFVIGAGASNDYGLPTSNQLRRQADNIDRRDDVYQMLIESGFTFNDLDDVLKDLRDHSAPSLDEFLESRTDRPVTMTVGRTLIAILMGRAIAQARPTPKKQETDWLGYIVNRMRQGASTCLDFANGNSEVRFVTFNFDSVIEDRLEKEVLSIYRGSQPAQLDGTVEAMKNRVIHVHGQLPAVPDASMHIHEFRGVHQEWIGWVKHASSQIRVVLDQVDPQTLKVARGAVRKSQILCFLGFAYARENLKRLDLPETIDRDPKPNLYGSARGLRTGEQHWVKGILSDRIQLGGTNDGCLNVLRDFHIFRD